MRYNTGLQHMRNFKFSKMSDDELKRKYLSLKNNNNDYFNKKELSQLINYLIKHNKEVIIC